MTEYDYSPGAYDRYMEKQRGVSSWIQQANRNAHKYQHPFQGLANPPTAYQPDASDTSSGPSRPPTPTNDDPRSRRPNTYRSATVPNAAYRADPARPQHVRAQTYQPPLPQQPLPRSHTSQAYRHSEDRPSRHRSSSTSHSQSTVQHRSSKSSHSQARGYESDHPSKDRGRDRGRSSHSSSRNVSSGGYGRVPVTYTPQGQVMVPAPRRGEQYVIFPGAGGARPPLAPVQVKSPQTSRATSPRKDIPLLKRLFTFGSKNDSSSSIRSYQSGSGSRTSGMVSPTRPKGVMGGTPIVEAKPRGGRRHSTY